MSGIFARTPSQDHLLAYMTLWYAESYKKIFAAEEIAAQIEQSCRLGKTDPSGSFAL